MITRAFDGYQNEAVKTAVYEGGLYYTVLGLNGEAGEVANYVKKILRDSDGNISLDIRMKLFDELGDVLWYVAACCTELGISMEDVAVANIDKLASRKQRDKIHGSGDDR